MLEQSGSNDGSPKEKEESYMKKCLVKDYFGELESGSGSAQGFIKQLFVDEEVGPDSCPAQNSNYIYGFILGAIVMFLAPFILSLPHYA